MNREIKFRGLTVISGEWIYGDLIQRTSDFIFPESVYTTSIYEYLLEIRPETKGQYTGLKDKNGTEIYEGDIISCLWGNDDYTGLVKFSEGAFVVQPFLHEWETLISELNEVEVVNDIYESKELLERDEE